MIKVQETPTIGRIVHVVPDTKHEGLEHYAAIVSQTQVGGEPLAISAHILIPGLSVTEFRTAIRCDPEDNTPNTWHWPERKAQPGGAI